MSSIDASNFVVYYNQETTEGTADTGERYDPISSSADITIDDINAPVAPDKSGTHYKLAGKTGPHYVKLTITGPMGADLANFYSAYWDSDNSVSILSSNKTNQYLVTGCKIASFAAKFKTGDKGVQKLWYEMILIGWNSTTTAPAGITYGTVNTAFYNPNGDVAITLDAVSVDSWDSFEFMIKTKLPYDTNQTGQLTAIVRGQSDYAGWLKYFSLVDDTGFTNAESAASQDVVVIIGSLSITFTDATCKETADTVPHEGAILRKLYWMAGAAPTVGTGSTAPVTSQITVVFSEDWGLAMQPSSSGSGVTEIVNEDWTLASPTPTVVANEGFAS